MARNQGIKYAIGKYLIFCDGDDLCKPEMITTITPYASQNWDVLAWRYDITQNNSLVLSQEEFPVSELKQNEIFKKFLLGKYRIRLGSFAIKSDFLKETEIKFREGCLLAQDTEFMFKFLSKTRKILTINDVLFTYATRTGSVMYRYNMNRFEEARVVMRIRDYVKCETTLLEDPEINDYLNNGFLILHSMYAFNSCILYLNRKNIKIFWNQYIDENSNIETELKRAAKSMQIYPTLFSKRRIKLFCFSRELYIYLMVQRQKTKKH